MKKHFTDQENEYIGELTELRVTDSIHYTYGLLTQMFLEKFPNSHSIASVIYKIQHSSPKDYNVKHYTTEQLDWLKDRVLEDKFTDTDIALAFDDLFGNKHYDCGHSQNAIRIKILMIRQQIGLENE